MPDLSSELAQLYRRDLTRVIQQLAAFTDDAQLWQQAPGIANSAGNLALHLEGNLRHFIGLRLGQIPYTRHRDQEFSSTGLPAQDLIARMQQIQSEIPDVIAALTGAQLDADYPLVYEDKTLSTRQFLMHLSTHLNYHLGQIDYLRRLLTNSSAIPLATL